MNPSLATLVKVKNLDVCTPGEGSFFKISIWKFRKIK